MRRLILVDDHRSYALVEIVLQQQTRDYAEFSAHALGEIKAASAPQLRQCDLQAGRRFAADSGRGGASEAGVIALPGRLRIERGQNAFDAVTCEQAVDRELAGGPGPLPGRVGESPKQGVDRYVAAERFDEIREALRSHAMRGDPGPDAVGGAEPLPGQCQVEAELPRQARQKPGRADVGKEADPDLRHGEDKAIARDPM